MKKGDLVEIGTFGLMYHSNGKCLGVKIYDINLEAQGYLPEGTQCILVGETNGRYIKVLPTDSAPGWVDFHSLR